MAIAHRSHVLTLRILTALLAVALPASATAAEIVLHLQDGRTVYGDIDPRTGDTSLWLQSGQPAILLRSGFFWSEIAAARYRGKPLTAAELRPLAIQRAAQVAPPVLVQPPPRPALDAAGEPPAVAPPAPRPLRVASVHIDASLANWDADPEDDGLLVSVYPLTADGRMRPVTGRINLKLFGRITQPSLERPHFPELTRKSLRVRAADFGPDGAVYKFPFRNFHPAKNLDVDILGLLNGRLVVAGQGAFDASDANVRLRPLSRFRDQLQLQTGNRRLPAETRRRLP